jgi:hypothetical protein
MTIERTAQTPHLLTWEFQILIPFSYVYRSLALGSIYFIKYQHTFVSNYCL